MMTFSDDIYYAGLRFLIYGGFDTRDAARHSIDASPLLPPMQAAKDEANAFVFHVMLIYTSARRQSTMGRPPVMGLSTATRRRPFSMAYIHYLFDRICDHRPSHSIRPVICLASR